MVNLDHITASWKLSDTPEGEIARRSIPTHFLSPLPCTAELFPHRSEFDQLLRCENLTQFKFACKAKFRDFRLGRLNVLKPRGNFFLAQSVGVDRRI